MTDSQLHLLLETLMGDTPFAEDEPTTWCTCDDCLSFDRKLRGTSPRGLVDEPLVLLSLSPGVLTRPALLHFLPALMLGAMRHGFGSEELRRGIAFEVMTQAGVLEMLDQSTRAAVAAFLRWAANLDESADFFAGDYVEAARQLESTGGLEARPSFAVTW